MAAATMWKVGFVSLLLATLNPLPVRTSFPNEAQNEKGDISAVLAETISTTAASSDLQNRVDQFQCQVDGRWLPLEWRCDFSEQCLDGQDEFGCVPESCDFAHDLCNWRAKQREQKQHHLLQRTSGGTWLRYAGGGGGSSRHGPTTTTTTTSQRNSYNNQSTTISLQQQRLRELHEKLGKAQGRFLFAPLSAMANENDDDGAHLVAPFVGQTNSMCRLRFRYALVKLAGRRLGAAPGHFQRQGVSLALFARNASNSVDINDHTTTSVTGLKDPIWSASLAPGEVGDPREANWAVGMAELGHLSRAELVLEARLYTSAVDESERVEETSRTKPTIDGHSTTTMTIKPLVALATLAELHFVDCAWPQAVPPPQSLEVYLSGAGSSGNEWPLVVEPQVECQEGQFQCASTKLCLESRRLCNFVNDCMSTGGGEDERHQLCSSVVGREDFEPPAPTSSVALNWSWLLFPAGQTSQAAESLEAGRQQSWTLASNLPKDIISVRSSSEQATHLPRHDHTLGRQTLEGHYLSLNISPKSRKLRNPSAKVEEEQVAWLYLDSGWLQRTGEETLDCRVKFFYNLIFSRPVSMSPPFKIYLALEHFVAIQNGSRLLGTARKLDRLIYSHRETYEANLAPTDQFPKDSIIELPGVDFWREANYQVQGLADNQPFYLRIVVIVRANYGLGDGQAGQWNNFKASLSIDDLATHFGCGRLVEDTRELDKFRNIGHQTSANVTISFNLNDYIQQQLDETQTKSPWPTIRSRNRFADCSIQYEPHKLVLCVLALLVSLLGAIGVIVFVIVPYVERITISYHDQLAMGLSNIDSTPRNSTPNLLDACELLNDSDWEQVSRRWRRQGEYNGCHYEENDTMIESLSTALDSRNHSQIMSTSNNNSNSEPFDLV